MQYRVYNRYDLSYLDSGEIRGRALDYDYLENNESKVQILSASSAMQGDIITLIENHGVYCVGCITSVDNKAFELKFKDLRELVNDHVVNPFLAEVTNDGICKKYDAIATLKKLLLDNFVETADPRRRLPLSVRAYGTYEAVWEDDAAMIDLGELIADMYAKYNIVLSFDLDFDRGALTDRRPHIVVSIAQNTTAGHIVKDNIFLNEFAFSAQSLPEYTACIVFDEDKSINSTWYLRTDNTVTQSASDELRLLPVKTTSADYKAGEGVTVREMAEEKLVGNIFNHFVSSQIDRSSGLLRREEMAIGDLYKIILKDGSVFETVYSGWKDNGDNYIQFFWGKMRMDYTAKVKTILRRIRHGS